MNEPRRIVEGGTSSLGRSLLQAALQEEPSNSAVTRALAAVATGAVVVGAASSAGAATAAVSGATAVATTSGATAPVATIAASAGAGTSAAGKAVWSGLAGSVVTKWLGVGVAAVALSAGTVEGVKRFRGQESSVATPSLAPPLPVASWRSAPRAEQPPLVASLSAPQTDPPEPPAAPVSVPAVVAQRAPVAVAKPSDAVVVVAPSLPATDASDIRAEVELLDHVRERIATGNTDSALGTLQEYERRFPSGQLGPEMLAMRMDAQVRAGDRAGALSSARQLIATSPHSPQAARARTLLSSSVINPSPTKD